MNRKLPVKIAAAAGALVLAGTVAAAAADDTPPEAADEGLEIATEASGQETLPVRAAEAPEQDVDATSEDADTDTEKPAAEAEVSETEDGTVAAEPSPNGEHGAEVVEVAQTEHESGRAHGEAVSGVASENRQDGQRGQGAERSTEARAAAGERGGDVEDETTGS